MESKLQNYFQQEEPHLGNQYLEDSALRAYLTRVMPTGLLKQVEEDFIRFAERMGPNGDVYKYAIQCENNPPRLVQYNAFGRRVDEIIVDDGWKRLQDISAEEGLVAAAYERSKFGEWSRLVQLTKMYLFAPASAIFGCPLSMTDGGARLIELNINTIKDPKHRAHIEKALKHFTTRDPKMFWTSGQWMTERTGGSDVGGTETIAEPQPDGTYKITGFKFFTSATTSNATFLLARIVDPVTKKAVPGSRGLSLFYMDMRKPDGSLNNLIIHKLKNKFGTKAVPTAELEITGAPAILVGEVNAGVKAISTILNITRVHNAVHMVAGMRRAIAICRDYAHRRKAFGDLLSNKPLHLTTLADMECEFRGGLYFMLEVITLLGKIEANVASATEQTLLRILTPLLKLYTAKQAIAVTTEAIESLGGTGYMEDSGLPLLYRNCQVGSIWEGTTNVLSLDTWRAIAKDKALAALYRVVQDRLKSLTNLPSELRDGPKRIRDALDHIVKYAEKVSKVERYMEATARSFAYALSRTFIALLTLEQAAWSAANPSLTPTSTTSDVFTAQYWLNHLHSVFMLPETPNLDAIKSVALDTDPKTGNPRGVGDVDANNVPRARM